MFLLKPITSCATVDTLFPLHSTMFLLILVPFYLIILTMLFFTFHYVSINTPCEMGHNLPGYRTLHTTMFLLIQIPDRDPDLTASPLHSTMFLLIRLGRSHIPNSFVSFTFHYVSIYTRKCASDLS